MGKHPQVPCGPAPGNVEADWIHPSPGTCTPYLWRQQEIRQDWGLRDNHQIWCNSASDNPVAFIISSFEIPNAFRRFAISTCPSFRPCSRPFLSHSSRPFSRPSAYPSFNAFFIQPRCSIIKSLRLCCASSSAQVSPASFAISRAWSISGTAERVTGFMLRLPALWTKNSHLSSSVSSMNLSFRL